MLKLKRCYCLNNDRGAVIKLTAPIINKLINGGYNEKFTNLTCVTGSEYYQSFSPENGRCIQV
jgi:hypothetical protein